MMGINQVEVKGILQKSNLPDTSYVINPYTGCVHGCVYCYARFMKRFTHHPEPWGTFLDAKINAPEVLRKQLQRRREPLAELVFLSSVTDPYQPPENQYKLTRRLLEVLLEFQAPISILTKSDLVVRDIDLLQQFRRCTVGLSLMTVDDSLARRMEPRAASPSRRIQALKRLKENGIHTYAFISPFLPGLSDLNRLMEALVGAVDEVGVEAINTRHGNFQGVEEVLAKHDPLALEECRQLSRDDYYWQALEAQTRQLAGERLIGLMGFYRHNNA